MPRDVPHNLDGIWYAVFLNAQKMSGCVTVATLKLGLDTIDQFVPFVILGMHFSDEG